MMNRTRSIRAKENEQGNNVRKRERAREMLGVVGVEVAAAGQRKRKRNRWKAGIVGSGRAEQDEQLLSSVN